MVAAPEGPTKQEFDRFSSVRTDEVVMLHVPTRDVGQDQHGCVCFVCFLSLFLERRAACLLSKVFSKRYEINILRNSACSLKCLRSMAPVWHFIFIHAESVEGLFFLIAKRDLR